MERRGCPLTSLLAGKLDHVIGLARSEQLLKISHALLKVRSFDIDYVIPLHCSGEVFFELAKAEMPTKLLRSYTGTRFVFDAAA
jgi:hypothetical protein